MSAAIQTLTNAKEALDADLITRADFDTVKDAFLRAQQLKAGLDAGFILEADYQHVKHAFFDSLRIGSAPAAASALSESAACRPNTARSQPAACEQADLQRLQTMAQLLFPADPQGLSPTQHPRLQPPHAPLPLHHPRQAQRHLRPQPSWADGTAMRQHSRHSSRMQEPGASSSSIHSQLQSPLLQQGSGLRPLPTYRSPAVRGGGHKTQG